MPRKSRGTSLRCATPLRAEAVSVRERDAPAPVSVDGFEVFVDFFVGEAVVDKVAGKIFVV